ncbi:MAG: hypothetical protein ACR65U_14535 [Methylocystis sp.]
MLDFEFRGGAYVASCSRFQSGQLAEVFIDAVGATSKGVTPLHEDAKDAAVCLSIALQYGAPVEVIRKAVTRTSEGEPTGIVGCVLDLLEDQDHD